MSTPAQQPVSFQTIRLAAGKHASPAEGACVMELASMLAGEPFSDRPASVSPAIAAFLRAYNDAIDDRRRQDLYEIAALVVGTRSTPEVEQRRIDLWREWGRRQSERRGALARLRWRLRHVQRAAVDCDVAAFHAVASIGRHTDDTHAQALALVRALCGIGEDHRSANRDEERYDQATSIRAQSSGI
jgi:hypothetical protein